MALNTHVAQTSVDFKGLAELRRSATNDKADIETLNQVAGQFEAIFVGMMLKSMREASLAEGLFDSSQSDMYRDMMDQQLAMDFSAKGSLGLKKVIVRQLGGQAEIKDKTEEKIEPKLGRLDTVQIRPALQPIDNPALLRQVMQSIPTSDVVKVKPAKEIVFDSPENFVQTLWPMAKQAADRIGVSPDVILAQAALETGWGKHVIQQAGEHSSHNLFNIKADSRWQGGFATKATVEYHDGVAIKEQAKFRTYESYQDSFNDYVDFLQTQPRYQDALKKTDNPDEFIEGLHKAGYATDPDYAEKIKQIMKGSTLAQFSQSLGYS